jgi:hypothetical protein
VGLTGVILRIANAHHVFDLLQEMRLQLQGHPHDLRDRLTRHVIQGGANAAGRDDDVAASGGQLQHFHDTTFVVAYRTLVVEVDADVRQLLRQIGSIRVDDLP